MRRVKTAVWSLLLVAVSAACTSSIVVDTSMDEAPILTQFEARVGKSYSASARNSSVTSTLVTADLGALTIRRIDAGIDALFSQTEDLPLWPPWQEGDFPDLDGIIELDRVEGNIGVGDDASVPDVVEISVRVCLYDSDRSLVACWSEAERRQIQRAPFDCIDNLGKCIYPMIDSAIRAASAVTLIRIQEDPGIHAWVRRVEQRRRCNKGGGCIGLLRWPIEEDDDSYRFARGFEICLARRISDALPDRELLGRERLQQLLYPLMESTTQPRTRDEFSKLLGRKAVRMRLTQHGVRYVVAFTGSTKYEEPGGGLACGVGFGGGGCLGFAWTNQETSLRALLWDLDAGGAPDVAESTSEGTAVVVGLIIPIPIPAATESEACRKLGDQLVTSIINQ